MIEFIVFVVAVAITFYIVLNNVVLNNHQQQEAALRKSKEQERVQARQEWREEKLEQQTAQQVQTEASKILNSTFYQELLASLKEQIHTDMKAYLAKTYQVYIKAPGSTPNQFNPLADVKDHLSNILGQIEVTPGGIRYAHQMDLILCSSFSSNPREVQISFAKNGYSDIDALQTWALAQNLSHDLGYQLTTCYISDVSDKLSFEHTPKDAVRYLKFAQDHTPAPNQGGVAPVHIRLFPHSIPIDLDQLIHSEVLQLQNSGISYKSPF